MTGIKSGSWNIKNHNGKVNFRADVTARKNTIFFQATAVNSYNPRLLISQIDQYIILSMELPGEIKDLKHTIFPDVFIVDYIKVYKKK